MCIDDAAIQRDLPHISPKSAMVHMLVALAECALDKGVSTLVSNYEPHMKRIYMQAGAPLEQIGMADGYCKRPVCCGVFPVDEAVIEQMRFKTGLRGLFTGNLQTAKFQVPSIAPSFSDLGKLRARTEV